MKSSVRLGAIVLAAAALFAAPASHATEIIQNGTFADSSFADWTSTFGFSSASATADGTGSAETGAIYEPAGIPPIDCCAHLIQTVTGQSGTGYALSLATMENGGSNSAIAVYWDGVLEDSWINAANNTAPNWVELTGMGSYIGTGSDTIEIVAYQNPADLWIDNVSLTSASTTVPEPFTLSLFGAGLIGAAAMRRRKAKALS